MAEQEYIVILKKDVDYDSFNQEMIEETGAGNIPGRSVDVANARPHSRRMTHYSLTDEEAEELRNDERVYDVHILPENDPNAIIGKWASQSGTARKTSAIESTELPWTIYRCIKNIDPWDGATSVTDVYNYTATGKGVDIVIQDSGIDADNIEFTDENGVSRFQSINWYDEGGYADPLPTNHNLDYDGHGSHVAGTAAGRTMGMARGARIYSQKISGLDGGEGGGISPSFAFDLIKAFHNNKPIDPQTGYKRPTVVNMSWGYRSLYSTVSSVTYRGNTFTDSNTTTNATYRWQNYGIVPTPESDPSFTYNSKQRYSSIDTDVEELIDAGVHVCISAGNGYHKVEVEGGPDYDNHMDTDRGIIYYHRGSSPYSDKAINVGNIDISYQGGFEHKAESSECGPGVDIYAPGTSIISVSSTDNASNTNNIQESGVTRVQHPLDSNSYLMKISGTSMASPHVAGLIACVLEMNPGMTPAEMKKWLANNSTKNLLYDGAIDDWDDQDSIQGGNNRIIHLPSKYQNAAPTTVNNLTISSTG